MNWTEAQAAIYNHQAVTHATFDGRYLWWKPEFGIRWNDGSAASLPELRTMVGFEIARGVILPPPESEPESEPYQEMPLVEDEPKGEPQGT